MNGYDAQDMATQGADGFRNGYQAGYADAVKAIEAAQPAAAQEAVAWMTRKALDRFAEHRAGNADAAASSYAYAMPDDDCFMPLYAAPVTAAPGLTAAVALCANSEPQPTPEGWEKYWDRQWEPTKEHWRKVAAAASTPAAPGIDNTTPVDRGALQMAINVLRRAGKDEVADALIDASPKGDDVPHRDLVPGVMRCAKCAFQLHRTNLYLGSGTTGPGDSKTEPCPNGCGPLWPVTWQTWATEGWQQAERYFEELRQLQDSPKGGSEAPLDGEVLVMVSGLTGSGKSAVAGEIEILCKALGLEVEWVDSEEEKRLTHSDWTEALELYKPRVRIVEVNIPRAQSGDAEVQP